jgi:hypothetical protein
MAIDLAYVEGQAAMAAEMFDRSFLEYPISDIQSNLELRRAERAHYLAVVGRLYLDEVLTVLRKAQEGNV